MATNWLTDGFANCEEGEGATNLPFRQSEIERLVISCEIPTSQKKWVPQHPSQSNIVVWISVIYDFIGARTIII